ncbi:dUTP diphosphatase [Endozoicomonas sp. G2_1]|uniref:dUTP diphosphatase n=1 Tax=Endozoicomonas sp. G2_1 TaxID=2821091 RepID=UPI001ADA3FB1|nr:dUTP diphosphatase [Endozoicomonas sp. G2_1]MBO9490879.1 dUTP diphosphatase [Endozoicomonas sp. G2_1]
MTSPLFSDKSVAINQVRQMLALQDAMNTKVSATWRDNNYEWYRAIWVECAEMLDHYGWKWWKHQEIDVAQVQLELVDIFHFGLSLRLVAGGDVGAIASQVVNEFEQLEQDNQQGDFKVALEALASAAVSEKAFDALAFAQCLLLIDMDLTELFRQYVGKNTLNFFRQDHGYKDGSYIKVWHGQEDNEVLATVVKALDPSADDFQSQVYQALQSNYPN